MQATKLRSSKRVENQQQDFFHSRLRPSSLISPVSSIKTCTKRWMWPRFEEVSSALNVLTGNIEDEAEVKGLLNGRSFDVVIDNAFKEVKHTAAIVDATKHSSPHFIYVSSAGMYKASDEMPHIEGDPVDQKSSKYLTEVYLNGTGLPVTHIRPVYVFGPLNYRDIEAWFWDRILSDRPVPIPGSGAQITNLGHVEDFVQAVTAIINKPEVSAGQIYNISGRKFTTLDGLTKMAAKVAGKLDTLKIVHYNSKDFDLPKGKAFPLREKHFFIETNKAHQELGWDALHGLEDGLAESLLYYLSAGRPNAPNFTIDETILSKSA
mmetsp:Transcript_8707/g.14279  ORF Transcript_8707/g.14279 Transcript_8707/m.14279 type:complete len:321 (+) Transcript_8707:304-1266(+)